MNKLENIRNVKRRVLIVDDEIINREILGNILSADYDVSFAEDGIAAMEALEEEGSIYSLVLLDLLMPKMDGFEVIEKIRAHEVLKNIPVIVMTSEKDAEVKSIKLGAADFITKPYDYPEVILARCERIIELSENKNVIKYAATDTLTGLYTKDFFFEYIRQAELFNKEAARDAVVLNITRFHLVNELYGREEGDNVLRFITGIILDITEKNSGFACRSEADTFCLYLSHLDDYDDFLSFIKKRMRDIPHASSIRIRIGVYQNVDKDINPHTWFDRARTVCDILKNDYTKQIAFYNNNLYEQSIFNECLINDMQQAIDKKQFVVYYQPKYGIQNGRYELKSAEALIRWENPQYGLISPGLFIPLFEQNGLIQKLDSFVWEEAASQMEKWREKYAIDFPISVNVSRVDIFYPEFFNNLKNIIESHQIDPKNFMLEVTESAYVDNVEELVEIIEKLRDMGFRIEMDDFGSGYSSLNMITSLPFDVLKMDMKFIRNMQKDEKSMRLVEIVMDIVKFLGVPVIAEGVEEEEQVNILKKLGCDLIQGYYFSKPLPPDEFEKLIEKELEERKNI